MRQLIRTLTVSLIVVTIALALGPVPGRAFERVVVFGDSLSDPGNHFIAFGTTSHQPFLPVPDGSYTIGGHHFSNGATWAEQLATKLGRPTDGSPALRAPGVFANYAVGGARARGGAPVFPFYDLSAQVNLFLGDVGGQSPADALHVVWIGANDVRDALGALSTDPSGAASVAILEAALGAVAVNVQTLWATGARTILVPTVPNPAITPAVRALGPAAQFAATLLTGLYNDALEQLLTALQGLPGLELIQLDVNALLAEMIAAPDTFGLANVDDSCLTFFVGGNAICATPNRYLFWDGVHPTTTAHAALAQAAFQAVGAP